jgi:hypothetical protein
MFSSLKTVFFVSLICFAILCTNWNLVADESKSQPALPAAAGKPDADLKTFTITIAP